MAVTDLYKAPVKPTVRYKNQAAVFDKHAWLLPIDHPHHSNTRMVRTSKVVHWDIHTGRIETLNTIYVPDA